MKTLKTTLAAFVLCLSIVTTAVAGDSTMPGVTQLPPPPPQTSSSSSATGDITMPGATETIETSSNWFTDFQLWVLSLLMAGV